MIASLPDGVDPAAGKFTLSKRAQSLKDREERLRLEAAAGRPAP